LVVVGRVSNSQRNAALACCENSAILQNTSQSLDEYIQNKYTHTNWMEETLVLFFL
jgi:hypothetical protein